MERLAGIEGGSECERLQPLVSLLADGELGAEELRTLRPHLKSCLACRALLREYRGVPPRVAALVPPPALAAAAGAGDGGPLRSALESLLGSGHSAGELATGQKLAAVAASAAALAGGGAAVDRLSAPDGSPPRDQPVQLRPAENEARDSQRDQPPPEPPVPAPSPPPPSQAESQGEQAPAQPGPTPTQAPAASSAASASAPPPDPANEFAPDSAAPAAAPRPAGGEFGPSGGGGGGGGGEFGP